MKGNLKDFELQLKYLTCIPEMITYIFRILELKDSLEFIWVCSNFPDEETESERF